MNVHRSWFMDHYRDYYSHILSNEEMLYFASQMDETPIAHVQYDMMCVWRLLLMSKKGIENDESKV